MSDTIAAAATGNTVSAIGIIRLSGPEAITIAEKLFEPASGKPLSSYSDRLLVNGRLCGNDGRTLDNCLAVISRAPRSYTGEDTAEFHCHGSPVVLRCALDNIFSAGARPAAPGEFTKRAFLNGKTDLVQAEAIPDLLEAQTEEAAKNAAGQIGGAISRKISAIYTGMADAASHYYAVLDYPDEDIEPFHTDRFIEVFRAAENELRKLAAGFERGKIMTAGVKAAIIGRPNAGKSSVLNALLGFDRSIVTDMPGTTRDTVEEKLVFGGVLFRLIDTAGLREPKDKAESIGIERTREAAKDAGLVIAVFDGSVPFCDEDAETVITAGQAPRSLALINKSDLPQAAGFETLGSRFDAVCAVSALTGEGFDAAEKATALLFPSDFPVPSGEILTNHRQADAVNRAVEFAAAALEAAIKGMTPDVILTEAEGSVAALGELLGKNIREDIVSRIFSRFCVGK